MDGDQDLGRGDGPPILKLLRLKELHRGEIEADFRSRFALRFDPPHTVGWGEACRLVDILLSDPSSWTGAAASGWQWPMSREALATADLYDAFVQANSRKGSHPKPYPRPWDRRQTSFGRPSVPQDQVRAALAARGHH